MQGLVKKRKIFIDKELFDMDFKTAYKRLQEISEYLKSQEVIDIQELIALQSEATSLHEFLQSSLLNNNVQEQ
ncbi:hypothetical protein KBB05_04105 [Patescibacteria group bacterium]|nr:hypothetical protein [Patescibacteria group bacterium]